MKTIPLVDLGKVRDNVIGSVAKNSDWITAAEEIREGLGGIGFLYLINHGLPEETISNAFKQSQKFFDLPNEIKLKYKKETKSAENGKFDVKKYSGYMPVCGENLHPSAKFEIKETYDWVSEKYCIPSTEDISELHQCIRALDKETKQLNKRLLKLLALALKLDESFFLNYCQHIHDDRYLGLRNIRLLHYPAIPEEEEVKPGTVRCGEHSDYGFLTMLFQDDVGGLEVLTVDGQWIEAKPIPGAILINTGDLIEFWTRGFFPATKHRLRLDLDNDSRWKQDRYSIAAFNGPDSDALITPLDIEKNTKEMERLAKSTTVYEKEPISASDYILKRVAIQYGYS